MKGKSTYICHISPAYWNLLINLLFSEAALADRRSAHNALERQRRENLNIKFQELAHALPSLQSVRRPSKTMIVAKSLEFGKIHRFSLVILKSFHKI